MRTDSIQKVVTALSSASSGMTARMISQRTGLSYNTVKAVLVTLEAEEIPNSYPREWIMFVDSDLSIGSGRPTIGPKLGQSQNDSWVSIPLREEADWPQRWELARKPFGELLIGLTITAMSDPRELASTLQTAATNLASIAYALACVQHKPDWFTLIGGDIDPETSKIVS